MAVCSSELCSVHRREKGSESSMMRSATSSLPPLHPLMRMRDGSRRSWPRRRRRPLASPRSKGPARARLPAWTHRLRCPRPTPPLHFSGFGGARRGDSNTRRRGCSGAHTSPTAVPGYLKRSPPAAAAGGACQSSWRASFLGDRTWFLSNKRNSAWPAENLRRLPGCQRD